MEFQTMPLRFRVWDSEKKQFYKKYGAFPNERLSFSPLKEAWEPQFYEEDEGPEKYIISQDTGLKDENGKSIFTGDIIKNPDWIMQPKLSIVKYNAVKGRPWLEPFCPEADDDFVPSADEVEVIGNIWENPELLEVK